MSEMPNPSGPFDDPGPPAGSVRAGTLTPELAALAQSGAGISMASRAPDGAPIVGLGLGCRLAEDGTLRILFSRPANLRLVEAIRRGAPVAVTFTATHSHRSFQVKASGARFRANCPDDRTEIERQALLLREGLVEIGFSPRQAAGYTAFDPDDLAAIEFRPERLYSQTPGPGAGAELSS